MSDDTTFAENPQAHRFEARMGERMAGRVEYNEIKGALLFTHTEVDSQHEGKGLGSKLAQFALDATRQRGLKVVPACQFIAAYIRRHPEYIDLVSEDHKRAFMSA